MPSAVKKKKVINGAAGRRYIVWQLLATVFGTGKSGVNGPI